jgi:predicted permease
MATWLADVRYALRSFARTPGFTAIVLLTVAVGTGANATVFSFVNALLLRPAPLVADPSHLVSVFTSDFSSGPFGNTSYPDFQSIQDDAATFASVAAHQSAAAIMTVDGAASRVHAGRATGGFFDVVGLSARMGRMIDHDDVATARPVAVVSDDIWRRTLGEDRHVIGRTIALNGEVRTIVGVLPPRFDGLDLGDRIDVWTPMPVPPDSPEERDRRSLSVVGRLAPGVDVAQAQRRLDALAAQLAAAYPATNLGTLERPLEPRPLSVRRHTRLPPEFRGEAGMIGAVLLAATMIVLLIACANVASLLLSRSTARRREIAVRLALGATPGRLVRQLIAESVVLGIAGGLLGLLVALWFAGALPSFFPPDQAQMLDARVDWSVLMFSLALSLAAGLLFGLVPAWQTRRWPALLALRGDAGGISDPAGGLRARNGLVIVQVALSCVLLISTGLLVRSLAKSLDADLGFATRRAVLASVELAPATTDADAAAYFRDATDRLRALPGVESVALGSVLPLNQPGRRGFTIDGYVPKPGEGRELSLNVVGPEYFETMTIPLIAGRTFDTRDTSASSRVIVVNESLAARYFDSRAIGRRMIDSLGANLEIVGVVRSGANLTVRDPPVPVVYYPLAQAPRSRMTFIARTGVSPETLVEPVFRALGRLRPDAAVYRTTTLDAHLAEALGTDRLSAALVSACGVLATLLAAVGVYGVMAYAVVRRRREIAVRITLGARPRQIVQLVVRDGLALTLVGVVAGLAAAAAGTRLLDSMLYGVTATDAATFLAAPLLLAAMTLAAAVVPIRRALHLDAMSTLRQE